MEAELSECYYWVDWSDPGKPTIKIYDEKGQGPYLTILEAREVVINTAVEAIKHWHKVASSAAKISTIEIEKVL